MEPDITLVASLIGEPSRARMLTALMGGKALTATELALEAEVSAQTASSHLAKLLENQLIVMRKQGRHRYFQLHGAPVAALIEQLLNLSASLKSPLVVTGPASPDLRYARVCYDHLAGEIAVKLYDTLCRRKIILDHGESTQLTAQGEQFFTALGVDLNKAPDSRRPLCRSCLDWSERRNHLAGHLGHWILDDLVSLGWAEKAMNTRILRFTPIGLKRFKARYGLLS